jgi:hypothetical protein
LIQEEMEKKNMTPPNGDLPVLENPEEFIEKFVAETHKNDYSPQEEIEFLKTKIQKLEEKVAAQERINELVTKNILQFDKNVKTMNEDFTILASAMTQIYQIFNQMKIIKVSSAEDIEEFLAPEEVSDKPNPEVPEDEEDDLNFDSIDEIKDWEAFKEKHKKKFQ